MLTCFLQQVQNTFDMKTANQLWRVLFVAMDVILLYLIPLALLKDLCCQKRKKQKKRTSSKIVSVLACLCFATIFLVDALIFNTYVGKMTPAEQNLSEEEVYKL